jgi:hypothetical protein
MKRTTGNVDGRNGEEACLPKENRQRMINKKYISTTVATWSKKEIEIKEDGNSKTKY